MENMNLKSRIRGLAAWCVGKPRRDYAAAGDLLRVACVFMIAWFHIWQQSWLSPVLRLGGFALDMTVPVRVGYVFVDLMLMLSGFLLYLPYANGKEVSPREFYVKRALRILPSYWFCLIVMLLFAVFAPDFSDAPRLVKDLLAHLGFVHNLWSLSYNYTRLNVVLWTLAVEVQFYLILPALAPVFRRHPIPVYLAMVGAALSFQRLWTMKLEDTTLFVNRLPNMLDAYANGLLAAHLYARLARVRRRRWLVALLGTLVMAAALWGISGLLQGQVRTFGYEGLRHGQLDRRWPLSFCGAAFLVGGSLSFRPVRALCSNRAVRFLSGVSFNFYIWHQWLAVKLKEWRLPSYAAESNPNMAGEMPLQLHYTLLCFAAALTLSILITFALERPCAKLGRRLVEKYGARDRE